MGIIDQSDLLPAQLLQDRSILALSRMNLHSGSSLEPGWFMSNCLALFGDLIQHFYDAIWRWQRNCQIVSIITELYFVINPLVYPFLPTPNLLIWFIPIIVLPSLRMLRCGGQVLATESFLRHIYGEASPRTCFQQTVLSPHLFHVYISQFITRPVTTHNIHS